MTTSSEFRLPAGDTRSEADSGGGDSTLDLPRAEGSQKSKPGRKKSRTSPSTVFDRTPSKTSQDKLPEHKQRRLGEFLIDKPIGEGSMGEVYLATQSNLDRQVALKLLPEEFAANQTLLERFHREARSLAELDHSHIVRVYALGEEAGLHYAAMEYIDGVSLQDILDKKKRLSIGDAIHITLVCAAALEHAHQRGIIHRDIKPANVLVSRHGIAKVADFGLVKQASADMAMTATGTDLGTPEYMAPEQSVDARNVTAASDIFSLGVMLHVMLTGELPYKGATIVEFLSAKQSGKHASAKSIVAEIPERLDLILHRTLVPEPSQRYNDCAELIRDLASLGRHNDSLSFCASRTPYVAYGAWSAMTPSLVVSPSGVSPSEPSGPKDDSTTPTVKKELTDTGSAEPQGKMWYVLHKNKLGKQVLSKMMTDELILALERKLLPPGAKVKTSQNQPFRPLSDHNEFHPVLGRLGIPIRKPSTAHQQPGMKRRRRRKRSELTDLLLRIVVGLCATYGFIRGLVDVAGLFQEKPSVEVQEQEKPNPAALL